MTEGLSNFRRDMDKVLQIAGSSNISSKAQRYIRAYQAGLPQDNTVRWFPKDALEQMETRVADLTSQGLEVWISQGLPWNPDVNRQLTSVEKRTDLIKGLKSIDDFRGRAINSLTSWDNGSWAKMFYDTPQRSLTGGTIRIDTNSIESLKRNIDSRSIRFEASSGISDVRDLDRQMSAHTILVLSTDGKAVELIKNSAKELETEIIGISNIEKGLELIIEYVNLHKPVDNPKAKATEPKAIIFDLRNSKDRVVEIAKEIKRRSETSYIPIIPLVEDEEDLPRELRPMIASFAHYPISDEDICHSIYVTGFRLIGGPGGLKFPNLGLKIQNDVDNLLNIIFGPMGAYRRMMVQIANHEQRPTIAFEFKLVPIDPYDFFFLDYEWSGTKGPINSFDWFFRFGDNN